MVHNPKFLRAVYGKHSSIFHIAKSMLDVKAMYEYSLSKKSKSTVESLAEVETDYWLTANKVTAMGDTVGTVGSVSHESMHLSASRSLGVPSKCNPATRWQFNHFLLSWFFCLVYVFVVVATRHSLLEHINGGDEEVL